LLNEPLYVVGTRYKNFGLKHPVEFAELASTPFVLPPKRHSLRVLIENAAEHAGVSLNVRFEVESLMTIKDVVLSGLAITFLPLAAIQAEIMGGQLSAAPVINPNLSRNLFVARMTERPLSPAAKVCEDTLMEVVGLMINSGTWIAAQPAADLVA
jgi:LysR family nitrogen assimilation transcriptional regulator